jgi:dienelactone hydrolase
MAARGMLLGGFMAAAMAVTVPRAAAQDVIITSEQAGKPLPLPGTLHRPDGDGPFPAVVMLVGCGGYAGGGPNADHQAAWAKRFVAWGYVALQVDSYSPRGRGFNCDSPGAVLVSRDAFAAKAYLSALPFVDPLNIAVVGWSMGGMAALKAIDVYHREKDDLTPAYLARHLERAYARQGWKTELSLTIYPNAYHSFDMEGVMLEMQNHHYQYEAEAATDALSRTREFLARAFTHSAASEASTVIEDAAGVGDRQ